MTIETNFIAADYLKYRLDGISSTEAYNKVDSSRVVNKEEQSIKTFAISSSDKQYLALKDTVDTFTKKY